MKKTSLLLFVIAFSFFSCASKTHLGSSKTIVKTNSEYSYTLSDSLLNYGYKFLNTPYRYGAKGPNAFDCSGFTSYIFRQFGYSLGADSRAQAQQFTPVRKGELQKGDLVFFEGSRHNGVVGHAGIVSNIKANGEFDFLHASINKGVTISSSEQPYYASRFVQGGRVFEFSMPSDFSPIIKTEVKDKKTTASAISSKTTESEIDVNTHNNFNAHYHTVQRGETLRSIAKKYDLPVTTLKRLNSLESNHISKGDKLLVNEPVEIENTVVDVKESQPVQQIQETPHTEKIIETNPVVSSKNEHVENIVEQKMKPVDIPSVVSGNTHRVKAGESLYSIAAKYQITVEQLKVANGLSSNSISAGQSLILPGVTPKLETDKLKAFREALQGPTNKPVSEPEQPIVEVPQQVQMPKPLVAQTAKGITHTVKHGETLYSIAKQYHTTIEELQTQNHLSSNALTSGMQLKVSSASSPQSTQPEAATTPQKSTEAKATKQQPKVNSKTENHTVKKGESLYSISRKYSCTPAELKKWNGLDDKASLPIGKKLIIRKS